MAMRTQSDPSVVEFFKRFHSLRIDHRIQREAKQKLMDWVGTPSVRIITLTGPTGAGKTDMLLQLVEEIHQIYSTQMAADQSFIPIASTSASAGGHNRFLYQLLFHKALQNIGDPFLPLRSGRKIGISNNQRMAGETFGETSLRVQLYDVFRLHNVEFWIIDEAHFLLNNGKGGNTPGDQYDKLMSLAFDLNVKLILCGAYGLPSSIHHHGPLTRRTERVQLPCYHYHIDSEKIEFFAAINSIVEGLLDVVNIPTPSEDPEYYYIGTCGCVGIYYEWLERALVLMFNRGSRKLTKVDFEETKLGAEGLETIRMEIALGEREFEKQKWSDAFQARMLADPKTLYSGRNLEQSHKNSSSGLQPGNRGPRRDPVGN